MGLRDLSDEMFDHYKRSNQMHHLQQAFSSLPAPQMIPADAYRRLVRNEVERVQAGRRRAAGRGDERGALSAWHPDDDARRKCRSRGWTLHRLSQGAARLGSALPGGFGHETHGVEVDGGEHYLRCLTQ